MCMRDTIQTTGEEKLLYKTKSEMKYSKCCQGLIVNLGKTKQQKSISANNVSFTMLQTLYNSRE